jgi:hypothetical protein
MMMTIYFLVRWVKSPDQWWWLLPMGSAIWLASWTRYEGVPLLAGSLMVVAYTGWRNHWRWQRIFANIFVSGFLGSMGMALWMIWNQVTWHNALSFLNGEYAKPSNWVQPTDPVVGNLALSAQTYIDATLQLVGIPVVVLGLLGLADYLWVHRLRPTSLAVLTLAYPLPFFIYMLYAGQRPMHEPWTTGNYYNTRFAVQMVPLIVIMVGFLGRRGGWIRLITLGVILINTLLTASQGILVVNDARYDADIQLGQTELRTANWLHTCYAGEPMLAESYGNEVIFYVSDIPLRHVIYEGSYKTDPAADATLWQRALEDPGQYADWIYMRAPLGDIPADKLWQLFKGEHPERLAGFTQVYNNGRVQVYRNVRLPALALTQGGNCDRNGQ